MDLYELLGVRRSASAAELRRAYQRLARQLHPALNPLDSVAAERYSAVAQAFEVLRDPELRARYDRGEAPEPVISGEPKIEFHGFDFSVEAKRASAGFREIFDGLIPGAVAERAPAPGEDLEQATSISFEESLRGAHRRVQLMRLDSCPICNGTGETSLAAVACSRCQGSGQLRASRGHMVFARTCPDCGGRGRLARPCARCEGEGRLMQGEWIVVEVPPGVASGSRVRVPGAGNAGRRGGSAGDFALAIEVESHPFFERDGEDLRCLVPVTIAEAAAGAHVEVPTPDGPVTIEVPAGTQPGQRFRLRKRGVPKLGEKGRGDLWVEVRLVVPAATDERSRALLRELQRLHPENPRAALASPAAGKDRARDAGRKAALTRAGARRL
jgi:molecular chaperone DnaJ